MTKFFLSVIHEYTSVVMNCNLQHMIPPPQPQNPKGKKKKKPTTTFGLTFKEEESIRSNPNATKKQVKKEIQFFFFF